MPRALTTGIFTRVANTFSNPVVGTVIDQDDADQLFDDYDAGLFGFPVILGGQALAVNLNSANTDTAITIRLPSGITKYRIFQTWLLNNGTTASITTATAGVFTATGGGGVALMANQALSGMTSNAINTDANSLSMVGTISGRTSINSATLQFRVGTAQGAAATADVYIFVQPLS